jgi:hypothetical protein
VDIVGMVLLLRLGLRFGLGVERVGREEGGAAGLWFIFERVVLQFLIEDIGLVAGLLFFKL